MYNYQTRAALRALGQGLWHRMAVWQWQNRRAGLGVSELVKEGERGGEERHGPIRFMRKYQFFKIWLS